MNRISNLNLIISILLHVLIFIIFILLIKDKNFLTPSRSDGIEVSIIPSSYLPRTNFHMVPTVNIQKAIPQPKYDLPTQTSPDIQINQRKKMINSQLQQLKKVSHLSNIDPHHEKKKLITPPLKIKQSLESIVDKNTKPIAEKVNSKNNVDENKSDHQHVVKTIMRPKKISKEQLSDLISTITTGDVANKQKGSAIGGKITGSSNTDNPISNYGDKVIERIRPYIQLPENINKDDKVIVRVELLNNLTVYKMNIEDSQDPSTNKNIDYNNAVLEAIKKASPFPDLPDRAKFIDYRILILTFKP